MSKWIEQEHTELRTEDNRIFSIVSAKCESCGKYSEQVNQFPPYMQYDFCPHCGEDMRCK